MPRNIRLTRRSALRTGLTAAGLLGAGVPGVASARGDDHRYYQVDLVAGEPIETLGETSDAFYGRQNRLVGYAHADAARSGDEVVARDMWINSLDPDTRGCLRNLQTELVAERLSGGLVAARVWLRGGCEGTFSLAVYPLPGGEFSFDAEQELVAARTETFGPGSHWLVLTFGDGPEMLDPVVSRGFTFGESVALDGSTLFVGDTGDGGRVDVFDGTDDGWTQSQRLRGSSTGDSRFGSRVAVDGDALLVSAPRENNERGAGAGAVYVFEPDSAGEWSRRQRLLPDDNGGVFGRVVDVHGSTALVTDPSYGEESRPAYVYERDGGTWERTATLVPDGPAADGGSFGTSGAIQGDTAVVGRVSLRDGPRAVCVFDRSAGWDRTDLLRPEAAEPDDWFGARDSVALDAGRIVVGAPYDDTTTEGRGAMYVFESEASAGGWEPTAKLTLDDADDTSLGSERLPVVLRGDRLLVGVEDDYHGGVRAGPLWGSAYLFENRNGTWRQRTQFIPSTEPNPGRSRFGQSVALGGGRAAVGAESEVYVVEF